MPFDYEAFMKLKKRTVGKEGTANDLRNDIDRRLGHNPLSLQLVKRILHEERGPQNIGQLDALERYAVITGNEDLVLYQRPLK